MRQALSPKARTGRAEALERVLVEQLLQQVSPAAGAGGGGRRLRQQVHQREVHDAAHLRMEVHSVGSISCAPGFWRGCRWESRYISALPTSALSAHDLGFTAFVPKTAGIPT